MGANSLDGDAALLARLVMGMGDASNDYLMHARTLLRDSDAPLGIANAFAGATLQPPSASYREREEHSHKYVQPEACFLLILIALGARSIFSPSDLQLVARIQHYRDLGTHGWFDRLSESAGLWVIREINDLVRKFPCG